MSSLSQSLTDSFFEQEEREAEGKGGVDVRRDAGSRKRGAPLSFQEEQERDFAEREAKSNLRREQAERAKRAMMAHAARQQQLAQVPAARFVVQAAPIALAADLPVVDETTYCRPAHPRRTNLLILPCPNARAVPIAVASL